MCKVPEIDFTVINLPQIVCQLHLKLISYILHTKRPKGPTTSGYLQ